MALFLHIEDSALTVGEVAAERRGKIPPHAIMMLSTICEIRWMVLWTKIMFSLLLTKSMTDLVEWLQKKKGRKETNCSGFKHFSYYINHVLFAVN